MNHPIFSIISPDYDGSISSHRRQSFLESVIRQSFPLWELILIHDGPRSRDLVVKDKRVMTISTPERRNDWGHSSRNFGLNIARGDYIIHCNADNYFYEHCLAILYANSLNSKRIIRYKKLASSQVIGFTENPEVLIYAVKMMGVIGPELDYFQLRSRGSELSSQLLLPGWPPKLRSIDAMQLVAKSTIWKEIGGWTDTSKEADGKIFEMIAGKYGYKVIPEILGEHW